MTWEKVSINLDGVEQAAMRKGDELFVPMQVSEVPFISVDGVDHQVESLRLDERDGVAYISIKKAEAKSTRRKSDDKPDEGRDEPATGEE
tara:strand:- start:654 stop:923 length:270 start_codon:yes stop_codon:yes gene_type:complete